MNASMFANKNANNILTKTKIRNQSLLMILQTIAPSSVNLLMVQNMLFPTNIIDTIIRNVCVDYKCVIIVFSQFSFFVTHDGLSKRGIIRSLHYLQITSYSLSYKNKSPSVYCPLPDPVFLGLILIEVLFPRVTFSSPV